MLRTVRMVLLSGAVLALSVPFALAQGAEEREGEGWRKPRPEVREQRARRGDKGQEDEGEDKGKGKGKARGKDVRPQLLMPLMLSQKGRAELKRHHTALRKLMEELRDIHKAIKEDIEDGTEPNEAVEEHIDEIKALAKKIVAEWANHFESMAKIAKEDGDKLVERWVRQLLRPPRERKEPPPRPGRKEPGEGGEKGKPEPEPEDMNPFDD